MAIETNEDAVPLDSDHEELMSILANQTTVAIRNAELYQQIPMIGMVQPLISKARKSTSDRRRLLRRLGVAAAILAFGFLVPLPAWVSGDAWVRPASLVPVRAGTEGSLESVNVTEGDLVSQGQILGRLRPDEIELQLEQVRAASLRARAEASKARLEGDLATYRGRQATLTELLEHESFLTHELERTELRAPEAGVILTQDLHLRAGDRLRRGEAFLEMADLETMEIQVDVNGKDIQRLEVGRPARFKVHAFPDRTFRGQVDRIAPAADERGRFRVVIRADNADLALRPGMTGRAHLEIPKRPLLVTWLGPLGRSLRLKFWM
jgi:multidrug efflux pump subunit AcrA (membrane-fusion protein)